MKAIKYYTICLISSLLSSCYEDKGNYDYNDSIQDIKVELDALYGIKKSDEIMKYTITPKITTPDGDKSYLEYTWVSNTQSATSTVNDTIGTEESVTLEIDPNDKDFAYKHFIRLYVKDRRYNTETMVPTQLEIIKPYSYAWVVLHEQNNHAEIGSVEYVGNEMFITTDAYTKEQGKSLSGKPVALYTRQSATSDSRNWGYEAMSQLYITTSIPEESGLVNQVEGFKLMADWNSLIFPSQQNEINIQDIKGNGGDSGLLICSNGKVFRSCYYSPFLFMMQPDVTFLDDYYISHVVNGPHTGVGFDKQGHRFVHLALQSGGYWNGYNQTTIQDAGPILNIEKVDGNAADPNEIDENIEIINMFNGYHYEVTGTAIWQKYSAYAYGLAPGNRSHVYVFRYYALTHAGVAALPYHFEFITPEGINKDTPMTSGYEYNNIIFYATGNKIYKLDCSTGKSTLVYQHEDSAAKISCLKMAVEGYTSFGGSDDEGTENYGHPYTRCLGAGINTSDGNGEFVVLQLNTSGKVDENKKYPSIQIHKGFGKITDINFI